MANACHPELVSGSQTKRSRNKFGMTERHYFQVKDIHADKILVLDFGSQYTQLIARRIRETKVYSEIMPFTAPLAQIKKFRPKGVILSGGPSSVYQEGAPICSRKIFELGIPILGICYGMQLMTHLFGGRVARAQRRGYGKAGLFVDDNARILGGLGEGRCGWVRHGDE